ncbi:TPA: hypothetical protein ACL72T_000005 [Streptococcus pneumoniae]
MAKSNFEKVESVVGWGRAKVKNISFETALGLIDFYEKNHEKFED